MILGHLNFGIFWRPANADLTEPSCGSMHAIGASMTYEEVVTLALSNESLTPQLRRDATSAS